MYTYIWMALGHTNIKHSATSEISVKPPKVSNRPFGVGWPGGVVMLFCFQNCS
jgi:hypothetical protein